MSDLRKSILILTHKKKGRKKVNKPEPFTSYRSIEEKGFKRKIKTAKGEVVDTITLLAGTIERSFAKHGFYEDDDYFIYRSNINR